MRSMFPEGRGALSLVPRTGPAPVLMRGAEWLAVAPEWERLTAHIESTPEAKSRLGWVREMYAFSIAAALKARHLSRVETTLCRPREYADADATHGSLRMHSALFCWSGFILCERWQFMLSVNKVLRQF
jgi:hypothetical protein